MTYWEAADILEHGSVHYGKILEAEAIALKVLKELNKKLGKAENAKFRELPKKGPLYGTKPGVLFVDEFCGEAENETNANRILGAVN